MEKRLVLALSTLAALGVVAYLARGDGRRELSSAKYHDAAAAPARRDAPAAILVAPPLPARATFADVSDAPRAEAEPQSAPSPVVEIEADTEHDTPIVVRLYEHATHDGQFPGETWLVGEGRAEAGRAFRANELSAIEVPDGIIVALFDTDDERPFTFEPVRVEIGAGLHNLAPYEFNDRADAVDVRRIERARERERTDPAHVTLMEQADGLASRLGRVWSLRLPDSAATRLFAARDGDYEEGAVRGLWVPARFEALLFAEPDGRGPAFALGPGLYDLEHLGLTQRQRSIRVLRVEASSAR
jgi:hypothetical protein